MISAPPPRPRNLLKLFKTFDIFMKSLCTITKNRKMLNRYLKSL